MLNYEKLPRQLHTLSMSSKLVFAHSEIIYHCQPTKFSFFTVSFKAIGTPFRTDLTECLLVSENFKIKI